VARFEFRPMAANRAPCSFSAASDTGRTYGYRVFIRHVLPRIVHERPDARLVVVGSDPPPGNLFSGAGPSVELVGFVEDIRTELARRALFVCPILSGSGVRVKLLEAFAAGSRWSRPELAPKVCADGRRILRAGGRPQRVRRESAGHSQLPAPAAPWQNARAPRYKPTGICRG